VDILDKKIIVILTAIGCPGGVSIIQALRANRNIYIIGTDVRRDVVSRFLVDNFYQVPPGRDSNFISNILDIVIKSKADVILPLSTFELIKLSKYKGIIENAHCQVCVSEYESLRVVNNKKTLYSNFLNFSFIPKHKSLLDGRDLWSQCKEFGFPDNKVVVKPFVSHGSIGFRVIDSDIDMYYQYRNDKPNGVTISFEIAKSIFTDARCKDILLMEYLPGKEFGVDLMIHPHTNEVLYSIVRDNGHVFHSEVSRGKIIKNSALLNIARTIAAKLNLSYVVNFDFKLDKYGLPKIIDINPRLPATSYLGFSSGVNMPLDSVYLALGYDVNSEIECYDQELYSYRGFAVVDSNGCIVKHAL
jgi:carbamoylphosphate synthase large subunit